MTSSITIAIDGPAGAGKSTVARAVAERLDFTLVDTGAIYRAVALEAKRQGVAFDDAAGLGDIVESLAIDFEFLGGVNHVRVGGEDVTEAIRTEDISMGASTVSAQPVVRDGLLTLQRKLAGSGGAVLEGRDIGTVVCPDAAVKIYLDAAPEERARRRWTELQSKADEGVQIPDLQSILDDVMRRDRQDMGRAQAPLKPASDAIVLDSTKMDAEAVITRIVDAARSITL